MGGRAGTGARSVYSGSMVSKLTAVVRVSGAPADREAAAEP